MSKKHESCILSYAVFYALYASLFLVNSQHITARETVYRFRIRDTDFYKNDPTARTMEKKCVKMETSE